MGSSISTTLTARAHDRLRAHLGLPLSVPAPVMAKRASTVVPDEVILSRFDVDARPLLLGSPDHRPGGSGSSSSTIRAGRFIACSLI